MWKCSKDPKYMWTYCKSWCTFTMSGDESSTSENISENIDLNLINCDELNEDKNSQCNYWANVG